MYLLDTDICSYIIKQRSAAMLERFHRTDASKIAISVISEAELRYGVAKAESRKIKKNREEVVENFIACVKVIPWDSKAAAEYAALRAYLESKGRPIGSMDMMIAAHALSLGATVVTNNTRHFHGLPKLKAVNWV